MYSDYNEHTGITEHFHKEGNKITIHKTADISKELQANQMDKVEGRQGWKDAFHKVASIPLIVVEMWREELKKKGADDSNPLSARNRPFLIAKLNNRDLSKLRTKEGRI